MPIPDPIRTVCVLGAAVLVGGCPGEDVPEGPALVRVTDDPTVPVDGDMLVVAIPHDPGSLDPIHPRLGLGASIGEMIQPGLVRRHFARGEVQIEPMLAERFEVADQTVTYWLREGLVWQDGTPITAADAAGTWSLLSDPKGGSPYRGDRRFVKGVSAADERTVAVTLGKAARPVVAHGFGTRAVVPSHASGAAHPLASGSYRVERWDPDDLLVLSANPTAPAALRPHLERVVFDVVPSYAARLDALDRGRVDFVTGVAPRDVERVDAMPDVEVLRRSAASVQYVGYDLKDPRFSDLRVRQALTMAIDRERLVRDQRFGGQSYAQYAVGSISPALEGWFSRELVPLQYDPDGAIERLAQAGFVDANRDGVREKKGVKLSFSLLVQSGSPTIDKTTDLLVAWWRSVGAEVTVERVGAEALAERVAAKDFDAFLWAFPADPRVDLGVIWGTGAPMNWVGYSSRPVDQALEKLMVADDPAVAQPLAHEIQRLVDADLPVTFLYWQDEIAAVHERFRGVDPDLFTPFHGIERWYVPRAEQRWVDEVPDPRLTSGPVR